MDDSDLEEDSDEEAEIDDDEDSGEANAAQFSSDDAGSGSDGDDDLQQQMKQIPFSALMKARQQMAAGSGSEDDDNASDFSEPDISDLEEDEFAQDRRRLAQAKAGKQPQRGSSSLAPSAKSRNSRSFGDDDEALEQKRREVRERLRQLSGSASTSAVNETDDAWAQSRLQREQRRKEASERRSHDLTKRSNKNAPPKSQVNDPSLGVETSSKPDRAKYVILGSNRSLVA